MRITEEVLLYDLNAIISGIGGSLGLFLGFSFLGLIEQALNWICCEKKKLSEAADKD